MIEAKIIADSIGPTSKRITSFILTYPRFIHSELMTHRLFSRNAASSRAIPIEKVIERVVKEPAMPIFWGKNQKGMQSREELEFEDKEKAKKEWLLAAGDAVVRARTLHKIGVHKQIANRVLEPYMHMVTLVTATEFGNFFNLRVDPEAQPEFEELAYQMLLAYEASKPKQKKAGEWHLPFADKYVNKAMSIKKLLKIVTARAARISYANFEGDFDHEKDYLLHDSLLINGHWSPFEHAAKAMKTLVKSGNFIGWKQYRKKFKNEHRSQFDAQQLMQRRGEAWRKTSSGTSGLTPSQK